MNQLISKDRIGLFVTLGYLVVIFTLILAEDDGGQTANMSLSILRAVQVISSTLLFIVPVTLFCRFLRPERSAFLQMNSRPHFYFIITAAACIFFALPAVAGLEQWNQLIQLPVGTESWMQQKEKDAEKVYMAFFEDKSSLGLVINLLVMGLVAALSEELFFRGLVQRILIKNKINPHVAIFIAAFLFSAIHMQFYGFLPRLFLGMVLGYLYYITQNLWVAIAAHFFNNAFAIIEMHLFSEEMTDAANKARNADHNLGIAFVLLSFAMVVGQLYFLQRMVNRVKLPPPPDTE